MATASNHSSAVTCAEHIALLSALHPVPHPPSRNKLETPKQFAQGYTLSLRDELRLVEALAFLANDSDDVNHIPALCVEQNSTKSSLNVLLAVNRVNGKSGEQSLQRLKVGFDEIFALLRDSTHTTEGMITTAIVDMCTKRILLRLRLLQSGRFSPKQSIQLTLRSAVDCLQNISSRNANPRYEQSSDFVVMARLIIKSADAWANHRTTAELKELVASVYRLKHTIDVETLFGAMNTRDMDPSSRRSLINTINKVARYHEIARALHRMSRKNNLLRHLGVITVNLPLEAYSRPSQNLAIPCLRDAFVRANPLCRKADVKRVRRLINTASYNVDMQFASQVTKTLKESKIHAEVQLLYYTELNPSRLPPRIVASSKDACFLCNAFIVMHGKLHTARTHGRLYPGWRLPCITAFADFEQSFNTVLSRQISVSLATLLSRGEKTMYPDPNESTLLTLPHSASTLHSRYMGQDLAIEERPAHRETGRAAETSISAHMSEVEPRARSGNESKQSKTSSGTGTTESTVSELSSVKIGTSDAVMCEENAAATIGTLHRSRLPTTSDVNASSEIEMTQGQPVTMGRNKALFKAGRVHLHVEYPAQSAFMHRSQTVEKATNVLEWLDESRTARLDSGEKFNVVDVKHLEEERTYSIVDQDCLLIVAGEVVVRLALENEKS